MTMWRGKLVYTIDEACAMLQLDQPTIHRLIRLGELNACCLEDRIGLERQHIEDYRSRTAAGG